MSANLRLDQLMNAIQTHKALLGIVGLGYVGLHLAQAFIQQGFSILGFDNDHKTLAGLREGQGPMGQLPRATLQEMFRRGFTTTDLMDRLNEPDVVLLCLPTPLTEDREPDLRPLTDAATACATTLRTGQLVVLESTTYPGTTRQVLLPILENSGMRVGEDFFLAYSPERIDPGNSQHVFSQIPKIVGATDPSSLEAAVCLYREVVDKVVSVSSAETAEAAKLLENTYRAVNISLVNELKMLLDSFGVDMAEIVDAARSKPFGFQAFDPGPGLGGPCIPISPHYLNWALRQHGGSSRLIEAADAANQSVPSFVIDKVCDSLFAHGKSIQGSRLLVLGVAYKRDIDDARDSPALALLDQLQQKGALVAYHDPHVTSLPTSGRYAHLMVRCQDLSAETLQAADCVLIVTDHAAYDWPWVVAHSSLVVDTRNATRAVQQYRERIVKA